MPPSAKPVAQRLRPALPSLTLDEALRTGAIVRGLDLDETEVRESEALASSIRTRILQSGDEKLVNILVHPDESWTRLRDILL